MNPATKVNREYVVVIGAPRSGTNMLRDVLTSIEGIETWPCDEINYIWRYGNASYPNDEIPPELATPKVQKYIRKQFETIGRKTNAEIVVEKTCANSLRVPFVNKVLPEAKYIFIYRDGIDATGSAKLRWTAEFNLQYVLQKVRFVPKIYLPYYALRYLGARIYRLFSKEKRLAFWGPTIKNMESILKAHSLEEICALQWQRCIESSEKAFSSMPKDRVIRVKYESFVTNPEEELKRILGFLKKDVTEKAVAEAVYNVSAKSLGKGRKHLGDKKVKHLEYLVGKTLKRYEYL